VQIDERAVDSIVLDQLVRKTIQRRQVRSRPDCQMDLRLPGRFRLAWVDHDRARRVRAAQPVELVHPENGLRLRRIDADMKDRVAVLDVVNTIRLSVTAECLLQCLPCRGRTQARIAVEVIRPDPPACDQRQRVVVLDEKLTGGVEPERATASCREGRT
jgi:hypothetical protein